MVRDGGFKLCGETAEFKGPLPLSLRKWLEVHDMVLLLKAGISSPKLGLDSPFQFFGCTVGPKWNNSFSEPEHAISAMSETYSAHSYLIIKRFIIWGVGKWPPWRLLSLLRWGARQISFPCSAGRNIKTMTEAGAACYYGFWSKASGRKSFDFNVLLDEAQQA